MNLSGKGRWRPLLVSALLMAWFFPPCLPAQELVRSEALGQVSLEVLRERYGIFPQYAVELFKVEYTTPDLEGEPDTASGLVVVPIIDDAILPTLCYQHGTVGRKDDVPSNLRGGYQIAEIFGSLGYFSVAPDYLGLGESRGFHPYLHAESEASAATDLLPAARAFAAARDIDLNDQLFITGYSQGGHAAAALHRALEAPDGEAPVTASALMAGPYSVSGVMYEQILSEEPYGFPAYIPNLLLSYDLVYGLFDDLNEVLLDKYANIARLFESGSTDLFTVNGILVEELIKDFGAAVPRYMIRDSVLANVQADPNHPFRRALLQNDLTDWAPKAPTQLIHCQGDDQVPFANALVAETAMRERGATDLELIQPDRQTPLDHVSCVEPAILLAVLFFSRYQELVITDTEAVYAPELKLFPNPASEVLYVRGAPEDAWLRILDLSGRTLFATRLKGPDADLGLDGLPPGAYLLHLQTAAGRRVERIIIARP